MTTDVFIVCWTAKLIGNTCVMCFVKGIWCLFFNSICTSLNFGTCIVKHFRQTIRIRTNKLIKYILVYYDEELFVHDHRCVNRKFDWKYDVVCKRYVISLHFNLTCTSWSFGTYIVKHFWQVIRILTNKLIKCLHWIIYLCILMNGLNGPNPTLKPTIS